ncbi:MAG: shikimate dehydrogenase [Solirubrobacterales bacterium]|nr:shikimate dehydrogenase [Solirubrobacterales bacterium]
MNARSRHITHRLGLIGAHLEPSLSPPLHEQEAETLGLACSYERIDIETLGVEPERVGELLRAAEGLGFHGVNITHPCKQLVIPHLALLSSDAATVGAVNAVVFSDDGAIGHNTDCSGFRESFARGLPDVSTEQVVLLGAGGAGAAAGHAALSLGTERLWVVDARREHADHLAEQLSRRHGRGRAVASERLDDHLTRADGLIHATPTGMPSRPGMPFPAELLHDDLWVAEVVYRPLETELLRHARQRGCTTLDGGGMAVNQAALSFALFTGVEPDRARMLRHFTALARQEPTLAGPHQPVR